MINNNIPYLSDKKSTFLALSAAIALLLLASPLVLSNLLLQPAHAQTTTLSFKTPKPATYTELDTGQEFSLTFDAQGETFVSPDKLVTNGTYKITESSSGQILYSGSVPLVQSDSGLANVSTSGKQIIVIGDTQGGNILISTSCSTSASNDIGVENAYPVEKIGDFSGPVECSSSQGGDTTAQQSSMVAGSSQDSDADGIPDSSDRCTHNSNPRCFKEGDTSSTTTTTTHEQQPSSPSSSSSSNRTGNQTR